MEGEVGPGGMTLAYRAVLGSGGTHTTIALHFFLFFPSSSKKEAQRGGGTLQRNKLPTSERTKQVRWSLGLCRAQKGLVRLCGIRMARDCLWSAKGDQGV